MSEELPATWASAPLGDLGSWGSGGTPSRKDPRNYGGAVPWLKIGDLPDGPVLEVEETISQKGLEGSSAKLLEPETLLVAMYGSIGKLGITTMPCATNQAIAFCRPHDGLDLRYLFYLLMGDRHRLIDQGQGGTQLNISQTILKAHEVPVAPSGEQKRIVSKIDELFSRIEEGERALERVSTLVERYRQSVLKAAVTGELTRDWREARKAAGHPVESGEALLTRILTTRRETWERSELAKMQAKGITPKSDSWKKKYKEPERPDTADLPELPEGWVWASLPALCGVESTNGISVKGTNTPPGIPALRLDAMCDVGFDYSARRYIPIPGSKAKRLRIEAGDFFVSRANGSLALVGRAVLAQDPPELIVFPDTMIRYRPADELQIGNWIECVWGSRLVREQIERKAKTTAGIYKVSQGDIAEIAIPVPPTEERAVAVSLVDQRLSQVEGLSADQGQAHKRAGALRQAILRSAFMGSLVTQDPNEEPASILLLQRLVAERAAPNATTLKRGRKKKSA